MRPDAPDDFLNEAFRSLRDGDQELASQEEVRAVVATARARITRSRARRRRLTTGLAVFALSAGAFSASPLGRQAAASVLDRLSNFLTGGADSPGQVPPPEAPAPLLNVLAGSAPGTERVIAQRGALRMLGYRDAAGQACISIGQSYDVCASPERWAGSFGGGVVAPLLTTPVANERTVPLWGLATAQVTGVEVRYADGTSDRSPVAGYGFIVPADGPRRPRTLVALDASGDELARVDIRALTWRVCLNPDGCP
jgi:hypothetical protein